MIHLRQEIHAVQSDLSIIVFPCVFDQVLSSSGTVTVPAGRVSYDERLPARFGWSLCLLFLMYASCFSST